MERWILYIVFAEYVAFLLLTGSALVRAFEYPKILIYVFHPWMGLAALFALVLPALIGALLVAHRRLVLAAITLALGLALAVLAQQLSEMLTGSFATEHIAAKYWHVGPFD